MNRQSNALAVWAILLGAVLMGLEIFVLRGSAGAQTTGILIGVGAGLAGGGAAGAFTRRMREKAPPEERRKQEIAERDEWYQTIREKAGYAAWYVTLAAATVLSLVLVALDYKVPCFLVLGLMGVHIAGYLISAAVVGRKM